MNITILTSVVPSHTPKLPPARARSPLLTDALSFKMNIDEVIRAHTPTKCPFHDIKPNGISPLIRIPYMSSSVGFLWTRQHLLGEPLSKCMLFRHCLGKIKCDPRSRRLVAATVIFQTHVYHPLSSDYSIVYYIAKVNYFTTTP